jgi:hypothetical protein
MSVIMSVPGVALPGEIIPPELYNVGLIHLLVRGYTGTVPRVQSSQEVS